MSGQVRKKRGRPLQAALYALARARGARRSSQGGRRKAATGGTELGRGAAAERRAKTAPLETLYASVGAFPPREAEFRSDTHRCLRHVWPVGMMLFGMMWFCVSWRAGVVVRRHGGRDARRERQRCAPRHTRSCVDTARKRTEGHFGIGAQDLNVVKGVCVWLHCIYMA